MWSKFEEKDYKDTKAWMTRDKSGDRRRRIMKVWQHGYELDDL